MHAVPGGPFTAERRLPEAVENALIKKYNLDAPLYIQFFDYLKGLLVFDLGPSFKYEGRTVNEFITEGFPLSARLGLLSILFMLFLALPLGSISAIKNSKWQDLLIMFFATLGITIPSFVIATALMYVFAFRLGWFPIFGVHSVKGYVLPVIALSGYSLSFITRLMRSSLLEVMGQDYIRTARAKGVSESGIIVKYALRNAVIPVVTIMGPTIASLKNSLFGKAVRLGGLYWEGTIVEDADYAAAVLKDGDNAEAIHVFAGDKYGLPLLKNEPFPELKS